MKTKATSWSRSLVAAMLGLLSALEGCIPEPVDIDIPQAESRLVVASQMVLDQLLLVQVSRSFGALEFSAEEGDTIGDSFLDSLLVTRGRVVLLSQGQADTLPHLGNGIYLSINTELLPGQSYRLSVFDSASGQQVFAESEVLPVAEWTSLDHAWDARSLTLGDSTVMDSVLSLFVEWEDLPGESYYMINAYRFSQLDSQGVSNSFGGLIGGGIPNTYSLSDKLYAGGTIRDTLLNRSFRQGDTLAVALSHISPLYYQYLTTRQRSGTNIFVTLLGEPVSYPSNVEGGYGMFSLHLPQLRFVVVK